MTAVSEAPAPSKRLLSLDAFRGLTVATMILVNNPGDWSHIYAPLRHADWHGCTPTDLVFPFFLFIVGVAIPFAQAARLKRLDLGQSRAALVPAILRRSALLFLIGFTISAIPLGARSGILNWPELRIMGVLQRIGLCYGVAALLGLFARPRVHAIVALLLMLAYASLMLLVPVQGHGRGDLSKEHNLAAYLDTHVFGRHVWVKPPRDAPPGTLGWEPEGLLSTLPAIATTLLGLLTGQWLRANRPTMEKAAAMLVFGVFGAALGYVLDRLLMPINKGLWTPSYVVLTAGLALLALGTCYWLIDVKEYRAWSKPAVVFGMNAIAVFVLSGLLARLVTVKLNAGGSTMKGLVYNHVYKHLGLSPINTSLLYALTWITLMFLITWAMYRMRIFIKV